MWACLASRPAPYIGPYASQNQPSDKVDESHKVLCDPV